MRITPELKADTVSPGFSNSLAIVNQVGELVRVTSWLEQMAKHYQLPERTVFKLDLVLNEALSNIISYAYEDQLSHEIVMRLEDKGDHAILEIIDNGMVFNPFADDSFRESPTLESASITGRGMPPIKSFTDGQEYQRIDHTNLMRISIFKAPETHKRHSETAPV